MEYFIYTTIIPFTYDVDRKKITAEASSSFLENNPGTRVNSVEIVETPNLEETEIELTITIEYENI